MSSPASFWAAKSNGLKSSTAPMLAVTEAPKPHTPVKNSHTILKDTTNGTEQANWADSDDDDDNKNFSTCTTKNSSQELEKTLVAKDAEITDLVTKIQERDVRITELEAIVKQQQRHLHDVQCDTDSFAALVEELKNESNKHLLQVQRLVVEVEEKERRIMALETEVDEQCATIAGLDTRDSSTQVSSHDAPRVICEAKEMDNAPLDVSDSDANVETYKQPAEPNTEPVTANTFEGESASVKPTPKSKAIVTEATGPAANLSGFPVFATPSTLKRTTPPPPAPKLKMGVDMSKFLKKPIPMPSVQKVNNISSIVKQDIKGGPTPNIDPMSDIRTKRHEERVLFANGPKVQVKMGNITLATVPKYVLMQCSNKAFKYFSEHPAATTFTLPGASMSADAATAHLEWMKEMTYQGRVYSITLHTDQKFDEKNLQICRAARVLGLNNMYVGHFTKIFCDRIRSNTASFEYLSKVAALAYPENDPINDCLANNLANLRVRSPNKDLTELDAFLERYQSLKARVEKIEDRMRKKQDSEKGGKAGKNGTGVKVVRVRTEVGV